MAVPPPVSRSFSAQIVSGRSKKVAPFRANLLRLERLFRRLYLRPLLIALPLALVAFSALAARLLAVTFCPALLVALALVQQQMSLLRFFSRPWNGLRLA